LAACAVPAFMSPASAQERDPTPQERARVEAALRALGFVDWGLIKHDDDVWTIEDVIDADGRAYYLELDADDFSVQRKDADD
ncbi:MAG: PepSY domain-containing protein, partial [Beijerinckiaceae bacterium]